MATRGRPSKYVRDFHVPWTRSLARRGLTVAEIAKEIGVSKSTYCKWVSENEELSDALNEGRSIADSKVEDSLYRKAVGFTVTERKTILTTDKEGGSKPARVEILEREVPPDTTACIFWLKNRMASVWREQNNISIKAETDEKVRSEIAEVVSNYVKGSQNTESDE